ncbi:hypothetical protein ACHHYP_01665 [Achlya hypogyna]|uniref:Transmembrane protein n=1 Tax=Achlya hypogyna TaxID=1202772 RepID=A0A1V9Z827_ACHHY|nr:hypothetical protein ACHHYP_01665 [Achlya hypogyna]
MLRTIGLGPTSASTRIVPLEDAAGPPLRRLRAKLSARARAFLQAAAYVFGLCVVALVALDSIANNWAINDFVGNGYQFLTPVADVSHANELLSQYAFANGASLTDLSLVAKRMINYTVSNLVEPRNPDIYVLSAGTFAISSGINLCSIFKAEYDVDLSDGRPRLGVVIDAISYLRGEAFSHAFTDDASINLANASMGHAALTTLGYTPTRIQVDMRLTHRFPLVNTTAPQTLDVGYYRIYPKAYCTGCLPIAELGHGTCRLSMTYRDSSKTLKVTAATYIDGSTHALGVVLHQTLFSSASHYLKFIALVFALGGYLASRRTVQWQDVDVHSTETFLRRIINTVLPAFYPHASHALRFDMFCYNSDIFVFLFATGVVLDAASAIKFTREVQVFLAVSPNAALSLQLFALSTRLLWLNCGFLKLLKYIWSLVSTASYCGESPIMGFLNLTSVTSLYLSAILLFYIPPFIEYNNSVRQDLKNTVEDLDGLDINFYSSFYVRTSGTVIGGLALNLLLIVTLDQILNRPFWAHMALNSLARQAMYNSTSILMDYITDIDPGVYERTSAVIYCKARRLCTLQWFFMNHMIAFGLPEKDLRGKKETRASAAVHTTGARAGGDERFTIAQDAGRHIHLLDDQFADVKNLMLNIKVLVKPKGGRYSVNESEFSRDEAHHARFWALQKRIRDIGAVAVGLCVVVLVAYDAVANNWAINDFVGNGYQFVTPIADTVQMSNLMAQYTFARGASVTDLSKVAKRMNNYTVGSLVQHNNPEIYVLSAGTYTVNSALNFCAIFQHTYSVDLANGPPLLGVAIDAISFLRGEAFSHAFTSDATANLANSSMGHDTLLSLGYIPARVQVDMRLTLEIPLVNKSAPQILDVDYYRIYSKSYCTGCTPIAELGHGTCRFNFTYSDSTKSLKVTTATYIAGSIHELGLMFPQTGFSSASHYLKFFAVLFAVGGYLASRRTVQWQDVDVHVTETFLQRILKTVLPQYYPHMSHALRFDMFCYNSDIFVVLFSAGVLLDISAAIMFTREVQVYLSASPNGALSLQLFALSTRLLWLNCAFLKLLKLLWSLVSSATYCGESRVMGFLNLTSVTSLYLSAILLFYIPPFIEYNNSVRQDLKNSVEKLDGIGVNFYDSFYVRGSGAIVGGLALNLFLVLSVDQVVNRAFWKVMARNSLARQAMFNSTSIIMDYITDIDHKVFTSGNAVIHCKARRLCTLQWFFMSHLSTFGLTEKDLRTKRPLPVGNTNSRTTAAHTSGPLTQVEATQENETDRYLVVQDGGRHIHLLNAELHDVKNLMINIKILKNTPSSMSGSVIVKSKNARYSLDEGVARQTTLKHMRFWILQQRIRDVAAVAVGLCVVVLVAFDSIANNWAINDFIGNGYHFVTPIADITHASELLTQYSFARGASLTDLSRITSRMNNYSITNLVDTNNPHIYILSAGTYAVNSGINYCSIFKQTYPVDLAKGPPSLGIAAEGISFLRGNAFSHAFTNDVTENLANSSMGHVMLKSLGYTPTRVQVDLRLTHKVFIANTSVPQMLDVDYYRIYTKAYCTGCNPIAELGHSTCRFNMTYNDSTKLLKVTASTYIDGSPYALGLMFPQTGFSSASHYLKFFAVLFAVGGYLASRRTVQWQDVDVHVTETFLQRILKTVLPQYYPHMSHALRFDMFCYNSDIFVMLFSTGVVLDISSAIMFTREVQVFVAVTPNAILSLQLFALSTRLLWLNCAFLKLLKLLLSIVSTATYCGESHVMGFLNLTSVTSLYLSAVLLFYVPAFIEYNNLVRQDLKNTVEPLDGNEVNFYDSFYVRGSGAIVGGLALNVLLVVAVDQIVNRAYWKAMARNSLARQAMYNSTSIVMDYITDIDHGLFLRGDAVINCKARRLCTLQWFFMSHLNTFGLTEKELRAKRPQPVGNTNNTNSRAQASGLLTQIETARDGNAERFTVVQDSGRHVHLLDAELHDVKNLMINIKILKNTAVAIH